MKTLAAAAAVLNSNQTLYQSAEVQNKYNVESEAKKKKKRMKNK